MGIITSQKIKDYYERFRDISVTFTKEIIQVTGMQGQQIHLKCGNDLWPCAVYSSSFSGAKVMVNIKTGLLGQLKKVNNSVGLRYCFKPSEKNAPVTFFVPSRVTENAPYHNSDEIMLLTLQFTSRPPDDLVEIMGRLLDANVNFRRRKDERVPLTDENLRRLNMPSRDSSAFIQDVPRRCILQEISFADARLVMLGVPKFLIEKEAAVKLDFWDPHESFIIKGKFTDVKLIQGKKEMVTLVLSFDEAAVPMSYKIRLNEYIISIRNNIQQREDAKAKKRKTD